MTQNPFPFTKKIAREVQQILRFFLNLLASKGEGVSRFLAVNNDLSVYDESYGETSG
jgi:hypothetical protein